MYSSLHLLAVGSNRGTILISRGAILNIKFMTSFAKSNLSSWADFITLDPWALSIRLKIPV